MALVTADQVAALVYEYVNAADTQSMEVFADFPSDESAASEGLYVARIYQEARQKAVMGISTGGSYYNVIDRIEFYLLSGQQNPFLDDQLKIFETLIDDQLFVGYHLREYTVEQLYVENSERYRIIFNLTRFTII